MKKVKQIVKQMAKSSAVALFESRISRLNPGAGDEIRTRDFLLGKQTFYR